MRGNDIMMLKISGDVCTVSRSGAPSNPYICNQQLVAVNRKNKRCEDQGVTFGTLAHVEVYGHAITHETLHKVVVAPNLRQSYHTFFQGSLGILGRHGRTSPRQQAHSVSACQVGAESRVTSPHERSMDTARGAEVIRETYAIASRALEATRHLLRRAQRRLNPQ